jgi:hypothetical protein
MNRRTAEAIQATTNLTFWGENPGWQTDNPALKLICKALQALPFSLHEAQKRVFFDTARLIAVSTESVVVANGTDKVDKFMFSYPASMSLETFESRAEREIGAVAVCLAGIALPTEVGIKEAYIFKRHKAHVRAVAQTQDRLDLNVHPAFDVARLVEEPESAMLDRTVKDLEKLLHGAALLEADFGYFPDIANSSGNLRRSLVDGGVTLIDVMPFYENGSRLVGDSPIGLMDKTQTNLHNFEALVGQYGA